VKAGRLTKTTPLSVRFVWMAAKETDQYSDRPTTFIEVEGTWLKAALEVARKYGSVSEPDLPFGGKLYPGNTKAFYLLASKLRIGAFVNLGRNATTWKRWLAEEGPILTRLDCDDTWMNAADTNGKLDDYKADTAQGGHAVALVGYDASSFFVRNSWGTDWGNKGFGVASNDYAAAAFTEAYGVRL
jgi:C1A family cysteine protease